MSAPAMRPPDKPPALGRLEPGTPLWEERGEGGWREGMGLWPVGSQSAKRAEYEESHGVR